MGTTGTGHAVSVALQSFPSFPEFEHSEEIVFQALGSRVSWDERTRNEIYIIIIYNYNSVIIYNRIPSNKVDAFLGAHM